MAVDPVSVLIVVFVLFAWSRAVLRFREGGLNFKEFCTWTLIWALIVLVVLFRSTLGFLTRFANQRPIDVIFAGSTVLLFYLLFRIYVKIDRMDQDITKLVREFAVRKKKEK